MIPRIALLLSLLMAACTSKSDDDDGDSDDTAGADDTGSDALAPVCTEPVEPSCVDQLIQDLSLHDDKVSEGAVETTTEGEDFVTVIDASAGGYGNETRNAWVYVKFTPDGAQKAEIDDETALESMDWDMSLRRFILRLNGGSSGPSCVGAASFLESSYDDLTAVPDGLGFGYDAFYTDDCTIINDSSGLPNSPQVVLAPWWSYEGCVQTTFVPHLVQLADGHVIKMVVETYYAEGQDTCNSTGAPGDSSGIITLRWRYLL